MKRKILFTLLVSTMVMLVFSVSAFAMEIKLQYGNPIKSVTTTAEPANTVGELKANIEAAHQWQAASLVLSFHGVTLEDEYALADYGIGEDCLLNMGFSTRGIALGAGSIYGKGIASVYFGNYGGSALAWQVLDANNDYDDEIWGQQNALLLFSQNILDKKNYEALSSWNTLFYTNSFISGEKNAIAPTKELSQAGVLEVDSAIFQLSAENAQSEDYGLGDTNLRTAANFNNKSQKSPWLTRSAESNSIIGISETGETISYGLNEALGVRPVLNLDTTKIAFTSFVQKGKTKEVKKGEALDPVAFGDSNKSAAWKLTLLDEMNQTLTIDAVKKTGNMVIINYSNAPIGPKQYISAMITDSTGVEVLYYGKLMNTAGAGNGEGTLRFTLPDNYFSDNLRLKVFSERCNSDKSTDFAGTLHDVAIYRNSGKSLMSFGIPQGQGDAVINEAQGTITLKVAPETDLRNLTASFEATADSGVYVNGALQISGETANDFSSPVTYMVVAEDDTTRNYTVTVEREVSSDATLSSFWVDGADIVPPFTQGVYNYAAKVSGNTATVSLTAIANDCRATVGGNLGKQPLTQGFNEFLIEITAEDGVTKNQYSLTIVRGVPTINPFSDVSEVDWFYKDVLDAYEAGIIGGISSSAFEPYENLTRGMAMVILYRLDGSPSVGGELFYLDVPSGSWYSDAIIWAKNRKIAEGYEDQTFRPNDAVSREQLAIFLHRYAAYKGKDNDLYNGLSFFNDKGDVSPWALEDVQWCVGNGYLQGRGDYTALFPNAATTRAEGIAALIKTMDKSLPDAEE